MNAMQTDTAQYAAAGRGPWTSAQGLWDRFRADKALLQIAAHSVGDGECEDERGHASGYSGDGDGSDHADDGLPAAGAEIARGDEEFKAHG